MTPVRGTGRKPGIASLMTVDGTTTASADEDAV
jgi:hypothetical protein